MFRQYFKILIGNLSKNPKYTLISYTSLTISMAAALLIYLWIYDELSYDKMHEGYEQTYRLLTFSKEGSEFKKTPSLPLPLAEYLRNEYTQVASATFIKFESPDPLQIGEKKIDVLPAYVDENFFEIFSGFKFLEGNVEHALTEPNSIILSEKTARILFGDAPALGQLVESNEYQNKTFKIGGVVKVPKHSHLDFGYLTLINHHNFLHRTFTNNWKKSEWSSVYIKLKEQAEVGNDFINSINNHYSKLTGTPKKVLFQPIANIHLYSDYEWQFDNNLGEYKYILIYGGLAIAIVVLAIFNFVLLSIARASERFNEIGYRKIVGASRMQILIQFITESFIQMFFAMISGLLLVYLLLPLFNQITGKSIYFIHSLAFFTITVLIALIVSLIAGIYPALYLSSFNPLTIFKGVQKGRSKNSLIYSLVTAQSAISVFLLIFTVLVYQQIQYINEVDLGMTKENIIVVPTGLWYNNSAFKSELLENPNIKSVSFSTRSPADFHFLSPIHTEGVDTLFATIFWVDEDFATTYNLKLVQGEFLKTTYSDYWKRNSSKRDSTSGNDHMISIPTVINETARDLLNLSDPIGYRLGNNVIVGVVEDFHIRPLQHKIDPLIMVNNPENIMTMNVKIDSKDRPETITYIKEVYAKHRKERGFSYSYFEDELTALYDSENRLGNMLSYGTLLAFIISLMGIFSLASFSTHRKRQEIGIRKVNGASVRSILLMLNSDFLRWVITAFLIALPISIYFVNQWLENYAYRISINWWMILLVGLITLAVSLLTVSWQCWKAAQTNPVEVLRQE